MGKTIDIEITELKFRIARYLYKGQSDLHDLDPSRIPTVDGDRIEHDTICFVAHASEADFETAIAWLYRDEKYNRRTRFLSRRWKILDWWYGPMEQRLYRHQFRNYSGQDAAARKSYRQYLKKDYLYKKGSQLQTIQHSYYNMSRLEELLPGKQWEQLQKLKHGKDYAPPEQYDQIIYEKPVEIPGVPKPPPQVAEWLQSITRGTTFERNPIG